MVYYGVYGVLYNVYARVGYCHQSYLLYTCVYTVVTVFIAHFSRVIHSAEIDRLTAL